MVWPLKLTVPLLSKDVIVQSSVNVHVQSFSIVTTALFSTVVPPDTLSSTLIEPLNVLVALAVRVVDLHVGKLNDAVRVRAVEHITVMASQRTASH